MTITPEGDDSTIGDEPTESGLGVEELGDPTADGTSADGTYGDGVLREDGTESDVLDDTLASDGTWGDGEPPAVGEPEALDAAATGTHHVEGRDDELNG